MSRQIDQRHLLNKCLVVDLRRSAGSEPGQAGDPAAAASTIGDEDGFAVFKAWLSVNLESYWSPPLLSALRRLTLVGLLRPCLLLITAAPGHLEVIRAAWSQRTLRAPPGYTVAMLGEAHGYNVTPVAPGQFTSLPEAVCYVIQTLNGGRPQDKVTLDDVCCHLRRHFPHLELPDRAVVFSTLGRLVRERKIYHTRQGYQIVTPETYQQQLAEEMERDALRSGRLVFRAVQTDLADIILGGSDTDRVLHARPLQSHSLAPPAGLAAFARRHSLKLSANQREEYFRRASSMRYPSSTLPLRSPAGRRTFPDETATSGEYSVLERPSLFSKLLRLAVPRRQLATFSAQFPPPEWTTGDVTHLHSVGTQTTPHRAQRSSAERSPKVLRSRRQKKTRPVNGSMDHLADTAETSAFAVEPQMAPRSSTLPRRTKLSEFLAETNVTTDEQKPAAKSGRPRHRSPRKKRRERLKSPADIVHVVRPELHALKGDSSAIRSGVSPELARGSADLARGSPELAGSSPNHAETLAQRHVRERLEARARHSSSRTSSGSSLERSDNSPVTSLERDAKLELPRQARDGEEKQTLEVAERRSRAPAVVRVNGTSVANRSDDSARGRVGISQVSPTHTRSSRSPGSSPFDTSRAHAPVDTNVDCRPPNASPSRRTEHSSPRRTDRDSKLKSVDSKLKSVNSSRKPSAEVDTRTVNLSEKHRSCVSNRETRSQTVKSGRDSKLQSVDSSRDRHQSADSSGVSKHQLDRANGDIASKRRSNANGKDRSPSGRRVEAVKKHDLTPPQPMLSHVENKEYFDVDHLEVVRDMRRPDRHKRVQEAEPVYQNTGVLAMSDPATPGIRSVPVTKSRAREKSSEVAHDRNASSPKTREKGEAPSLRRQEQRVYSSQKHHKDLVTPSLNTQQVYADVIPTSDVTHPLCDVTRTPGDISSDLRSPHRRKDHNASPVLHSLERKQMNNEKVLEAISPTRPERLSVKNIFHELSAPAKVPPKSLPDGMTPDPRLARPLTYRDLVKTQPAKMADVTLPATKMADAAPAPAKMADAAATQPAETPSETAAKRPGSPGDTSLRTYPSLSSLNLNFKSLAAQRLMHGTSANSIDTLVEVNMAAERRRSSGSTETMLLGIL